MSVDGDARGWRVEEEVTAAGQRRVFLRAPGAASLGKQIKIVISRPVDPPFLTDAGWLDDLQPLTPEWVEVDGNDLLIELSTDHTDEIGDFETIEVRIPGSDLQGTLAWVLEPLTRRPKPRIRLIVDPASVNVRGTVRLSWDAENVGGLVAGGTWSGGRDLSGEEAVTLEHSGEFEFTLADQEPGLGERTVARVVVTVRDPVAATAPVQPADSHTDTKAGGAGPGSSSPPNRAGSMPKGVLWIIAAVAVLVFAGVLLFFVMNRPDNTPPDPAPAPCEASNTCNEESGGGGGSSGGDTPGEETLEDQVRRLRELIDNEQYEDDPANGIPEGARSLLQRLLGEGSREAAMIAAELSRGPGFQEGLFEERSDRHAMQYYRLACEGGAGARDALSDWLAQLQVEYDSQPSETVRDLVQDHIPDLMASCEN